MASSRIFLLVCMLACTASLALAGDLTLGTVNGACKDEFSKIMKSNYADDTKCADLIKTAMSTAPKSDADCPNGAKADAGSAVQKCMSKNENAKAAWIAFIKQCEVMNVNERTGAGEAEAAANAKPSCFPRFNSLQAFRDYMDGKGPRSSTAAAKASGALVAATAAVYLLL